MELVKTELNTGIENLITNRNTFIEKVLPILKPNQDFYEIMNKKSLAKGGAEKLATIFNLTAEFSVDSETMGLLKQDGLVAYVCNLKSGDDYKGQGRGADTLGRNKADANKTIKMAQKRAFVDAVIRTTGLSDIFTQDLEDFHDEPVKQYPIKKTYQKVAPADPKKMEIKKLCDDIDPLASKAEDYAKIVLEKTGLALLPENYDEIIKKMKPEVIEAKKSPEEEAGIKPWETDPRFTKGGQDETK
jgi:hypothetical protein